MTYLGFILVILSEILLGLVHAVEPDHIATLRLLRTKGKVYVFALSHALGYLFVGFALTLVFSIDNLFQILGYVIGILFSLLLIISTLMDRDLEIGFGSGLIQGALAVTPTKVSAAVIASSLGDFIGLLMIVIFSFSTALGLVLVGRISLMIPIRFSKVFNIVAGVISLIFIAYLFLSR